MKHVKTLTVHRADTKQFDDPFAAVFFQIWLSVFAAIISGAFNEK